VAIETQKEKDLQERTEKNLSKDLNSMPAEEKKEREKNDKVDFR